MKKSISIVILFLLCFSVYAQDLKNNFFYTDEAGARELADSIAANARRALSYYDYDFNRHSQRAVFEYRESREKHETRLLFIFYKMQIGENKDLDIEGKTVYLFSEVEGRLTDLYSFWKKHINPNAPAIEQLAENKKDSYHTTLADGRKAEIKLYKMEDWHLQLYVYSD